MLRHRGGTLVAWVDRFNKARLSKNPASRHDISLSTTAMALIPTGSLRGHYAGHRTPDSLYSDVAQHVAGLQDAWVSFTASESTLCGNTWVLSWYSARWTFAARRLRLPYGTPKLLGICLSPQPLGFTRPCTVYFSWLTTFRPQSYRCYATSPYTTGT